MTSVLVLTNVLTLLAAIVFGVLFLRYYRRVQWAKGNGPGAIPSVRLEDFHPVFARDEHGPTLDSVVRFFGAGDGVHGGTTDREAWILAALAKDARFMFEFGTCTGRTTYLWAVNSPPDARIVTLTLPPAQQSQYQAAPGDSRSATKQAVSESRFDRFRYSGTAVEHKIEQLYGDSKQLDDAAYAGRCDVIFVDGSHAYSYVKSDSAKALRMIRPGGVILWHDYRPWGGTAAGVFEYLNELQRRIPLVRFRDSSLVAYRHPVE